MIYLHLESVVSDIPIDEDTTTSGDFPKVMDLMDKLLWEWSLISTSENAKNKKWWDRIFMLPRNHLVLVDDLYDAAPGATLVSRDLNVCRLWWAAGGASYWINNGEFHDANGANSEFLSRIVARAFDDIVQK